MRTSLKCVLFASALILGSQRLSAQATNYVIDPQKDAAAFKDATIEWHQIGKNAEAAYVQINMFDCVESISLVRYKSASHKTDVVSCEAENRSVTSLLGDKLGASAAINGSYFNVKTLRHTTYYKDNGVQVGWTDNKEINRVNGLFCVKGKKCFVIEQADTNLFGASAKKYKDALASGPVLLQNGRYPDYLTVGSGANLSETSYDSPFEPDASKSFWTYRHPRTFIGVDAAGWVYYGVIDGRFPGQGDGATIAETAFIAKMLGMTDALNLDGGGSSTLWTAKDGVVNHPYDNHKFDHQGEREVPNVVVVY